MTEFQSVTRAELEEIRNSGGLELGVIYGVLTEKAARLRDLPIPTLDDLEEPDQWRLE